MMIIQVDLIEAVSKAEFRRHCECIFSGKNIRNPYIESKVRQSVFWRRREKTGEILQWTVPPVLPGIISRQLRIYIQK
jgi:hypothetical protein